MDDFKFFLPLQKEAEDWLVGIASTLSVDRDTERMSENALTDMRNQIITSGVNLFGNHQHDWENTLGVIKEASLNNNQLGIKIFLDSEETNNKVKMLKEKLKRGIKLGLSVGGSVTKVREEYNKELHTKVKVIDGVKLYEVSVVGIPSNADSFLSLPQAISKSLTLNNKRCNCCYSKIENKCPVCLWSKDGI